MFGLHGTAGSGRQGFTIQNLSVSDNGGSAVIEYEYDGAFVNGRSPRSGTISAGTATTRVSTEHYGHYRLAMRARNAIGWGPWSSYKPLYIAPDGDESLTRASPTPTPTATATATTTIHAESAVIEYEYDGHRHGDPDAPRSISRRMEMRA